MVCPCNYLRYAVTILAAFGCFFAYVCRLNLSLAILSMIERPENVSHIREFRSVDEIIPQPVPEFKPEPEPEPEKAAQVDMVIDVSLNKSLASSPYGTVQGQHRLLMIDLQRANRLPTPLALDRHNDSNDDTTESDKNLDENSPVDSKNPRNKVPWSKDDEALVLGAFFYGYVVIQIPAARAAETLGAKWIFLVTGMGSGLMSLIFPWCALSGHLWMVFVLRFTMGMSQAALFAAAYVLLGEWLPPAQRSRWIAVPSGFSRFGTIGIYLLCGPIIECFDWEMVFYVSGFVTLVWSLIWLVIASSRPQTSWLISKAELMHIEAHMEPSKRSHTAPTPKNQRISNMTSATSTSQLTSDEPPTQPKVDYCKMARSRPVWLLTLLMFSSEWSNMLLLIKLPQFLEHALRMNLNEAGQLSACLVAVYCLVFPLSGYMAALVVERTSDPDPDQIPSTIMVRKCFELVAQLLQAGACFVIPFFGHSTYVIVAMLFVLMLGRSIVGGGQCQMPSEMSTEFPGTLFAFANTFANMAGFLGPRLVSWMVSDTKNFADWFDLWIVSGVIFVSVGIVFMILGNNEPRDYARTSPVVMKPAASLNGDDFFTMPYNIAPGTKPSAIDRPIEMGRIRPLNGSSSSFRGIADSTANGLNSKETSK